jgi:hypothetical protein
MITPWDDVPMAERPIHHPISSDLADKLVERTTPLGIVPKKSPANGKSSE